MEQVNMSNKIQAIKDLFKNIRETLSPEEINEIRTKIYRNTKLYEYYASKTKLNQKQANSFNKAINNLNNLHEYLLNKEPIHDADAPYELGKLFDHHEYYKPTLVKRSFNGNYVKYNSTGDLTSSIDEYFEKINFYLSNLIYYYMLKGEWKIQLSMQVSFISLTNEESDIMHSKSDNVEIMSGRSTDIIVDELINSFKQRYQESLDKRMRGSSYVFNHVKLLEYHLHKISLSRGSSYLPTLQWIANKKCTINPKNTKDNRCYLYLIVTALNYHKINNHPERISNLIPFISNPNWDEINFPAGPKEYSAFENYNVNIALNIFYVPHKETDIRPVYISKFNKTREHHANLLMITDGKDIWHYIAIRSITSLLRGVSSTHQGDYYCLNCFHSYRTESTLKKHEELCINNKFPLIKVPTEDKKYIHSTLIYYSCRL